MMDVPTVMPGTERFRTQLAELIGVLVHPLTSLLNGQVLVADGGWGAFEEQMTLLGQGGLPLPGGSLN